MVASLTHMQILECNLQLAFHMLQQQLIEYIRAGDTITALEFAQEELAPRAESSVQSGCAYWWVL